MDYTIVTAWYDVRTRENHELKDKINDDYFCSKNTYFEKARLLFNKPFPLVIFTEPQFKDEILALRPQELHPITQIITKDYEELTFYEHFKRFEENHIKYKVINLDLIKFTPLYKFIVTQKTNFVKEVVESNPFNTTKFAWMDLRLHDRYDMPIEETNRVMSEILPGRVKLMFMTWLHPREIYDRHDFYEWTRGKVAAGFFGGEREPLLKFAELCQNEFMEAVHWDTCPTDEMIYSWITHYNPHLFDPYVGEYGDCLKNQVKTRGALHLYIPFLLASRDYNNSQYVAQISRNLRRGYLDKEIHLPPHDIDLIWYNAFNAYYQLQLPEECKEVLKEYIQFTKDNPEVIPHFTLNKQEFADKARQMGFSFAELE